MGLSVRLSVAFHGPVREAVCEAVRGCPWGRPWGRPNLPASPARPASPASQGNTDGPVQPASQPHGQPESLKIVAWAGSQPAGQ